MKKIIVSVLVIGLLLTSSIASVNAFDGREVSTKQELAGPPIPYADIYVDDDAPPEWYDATHVKTIQEGVNNATIGDIVYVFSGTYTENLVIDKSITLRGEDNNQTKIAPYNEKCVVKILSNNVNIKGFTIQNSLENPEWAAILVLSDHNKIVNNRIVKNSNRGIVLIESSYNIIRNNYLSDNAAEYIFLIDNSNYNNIFDNYLTRSDDWDYAARGIWLRESIENNIKGNILTDGKFDVGISLYFGADSNIVTKNIMQNNQDEESNCIQIWGGDYNKVIDNEIKNTAGNGICLLPQTEGNEISKNTLQSIGRTAIGVAHSRKTIIKENEISNAENSGIGIGIYSTNNEITSNNISNCGRGIYLSGTSRYEPSNNIVTKNNLIENEYGIYINNHEFYGESNYNKIYHNNFIDNNQNAYDECTNTWYKFKLFGKSMGNYWDDYKGKDNDGDGIGDTPYNVPPRILFNKDRFPLMNPYDGNSNQNNQQSSSQQSTTTTTTSTTTEIGQSTSSQPTSR